MRKEFTLYLFGIILLSILVGMIIPLSNSSIVKNDITNISVDGDEISFKNKYGSFISYNKNFIEYKKVDTVYTDTLLYYVLFQTAADEQTINRINEDTKLSKFHCFIASTPLIGFVIALTIIITIAIISFVIHFIIMFFEKIFN